MQPKPVFSAAFPKSPPHTLVVFPMNVSAAGVQPFDFLRSSLKHNCVGSDTSCANPETTHLKGSYLNPAQTSARSAQSLPSLTDRPNVRLADRIRIGLKLFSLKSTNSPELIAIMWPIWPKTEELFNFLSRAYVTCLIALNFVVLIFLYLSLLFSRTCFSFILFTEIRLTWLANEYHLSRAFFLHSS